MGINQLFNDNLRKLPNEYGDVSVMGWTNHVGLASSTGRMASLYRLVVRGRTASLYRLIVRGRTDSHCLYFKCKHQLCF